MKSICTMFWLLMATMSVIGSEIGHTRPFLRTGPWYPADPVVLTTMLDRMMAGPGQNTNRTIRGMVVPHAGLSYSGPTAGRAYRLLKGQPVDRIILLGVAHRKRMSGACLSTFDFNATPLGRIELDRLVINRLARQPGFQVDNDAMIMEHSIENQLPFLQRALEKRDFRLVPILVGHLDESLRTQIVRAIRPLVSDTTLVIASSDLTHYGQNYGFAPFTSDVPGQIKKLDMGLIDILIRRDATGLATYRKETGITACGIMPMSVLCELMRPESVTGRLVAYSLSGDREDDYSLSVSYGAVVFETTEGGSGMNTPETDGPGHLTEKHRTFLLQLARRTLKRKLGGVDMKITPADYPPALQEPRSVFVTLRKKGRLRGCIGNLGDPAPLVESVREYAVKAALEDPRFPPVTREELSDITIEISVMTPLKEIPHYRLIRLGVDGVVIRKGYRGAVYLPQVATETGWSLDTLMTNLCRKAGLPDGAYRSPGAELQVFQAEVFHEGNTGP